MLAEAIQIKTQKQEIPIDEKRLAQKRSSVWVSS